MARNVFVMILHRYDADKRGSMRYFMWHPSTPQTRNEITSKTAFQRFQREGMPLFALVTTS